jgi:hypothetical protein
VTERAQALRERNGRWRRGVSGNPRGRPRGSKDHAPRRHVGYRENVVEWTERDWLAFYRHAFQQAEGHPDAKHGVAYSECVALWLLLNRPVQRAGMCAHCGKTLDLPISTVNARRFGPTARGCIGAACRGFCGHGGMRPRPDWSGSGSRSAHSTVVCGRGTF